MKFHEFIDNVQSAAGLGTTQEAEKVTRATLRTLARRLSEDEAADLGTQLPPELAGEIETTATAHGNFGIDEFFERVGVEAGIDRAAEAERRTRAVTGVLADAVTKGELADVFTELPDDFVGLFAPTSWRDTSRPKH